MTYKDALEQKDGQLVLKLFDTKLKAFILRAQSLYDDFIKAPDYDSKTKNHIRHEYSKNWLSFVDEKVPFELMLYWKDGTTTVRIRDVVSNQMLDGFDKKLNEEVIDAIARYSAFILKKNNMLYEQILDWQVLKLVMKCIDVSSMCIKVENVIDICKKVMSDTINENEEIPQSMLYLNKMHKKRLSGSKKVGIYRQEILNPVLEDYCYTFKKNFGRYPLRQELRLMLQNFCKESNNPHLAIFTKPNALSEKTLTKFIKGFNTMRQRKKKIAQDNATAAGEKAAHINLLEMYNSLNEQEKIIFKEILK